MKRATLAVLVATALVALVAIAVNQMDAIADRHAAASTAATQVALTNRQRAAALQSQEPSLARTLAQQSEREAAATHARLMDQLNSRPQITQVDRIGDSSSYTEVRRPLP